MAPNAHFTPVTPRIQTLDLQQVLEKGEYSQQFLNQFRSILEDTGFCYLTNHGIPMELIHESFKVTAKFFEKPRSEREKHRAPCVTGQGWIANERETLNVDTPDYDLKEMFDTRLGSSSYDNWPNEDFKRVTMDLYERFYSLCRALIDALMLLEPQKLYFLQKVHSDVMKENGGNNSSLRYLYYASAVDSQIEGRCGEHTDFGTFTLLYQDPIGGLQVRDNAKTDEFIDVPFKEDTLIFNVADILQIWTEGKFVSGSHRVVANQNGRVRRSMPFFLHPSFDPTLNPFADVREQILGKVKESNQSAD